ncbi:unnamed protein product [Leptosia nina]|uniref:Uncharacterized protein n=1 Tax=Leptosia nina TaxID=320188 RepID=A0AAV1K137_9NEOP
MYKFVLFIALCMMVSANPTWKRSSSPLELITVIELEEACVRQGGICVRIEDCDPSNIVHMRGKLCPNQKHLGVECCYM